MTPDRAAGALRGTHHGSQDAATPDAATAQQQAMAAEVRRQARLATLSRSCGIWAGEPDMPRDGVIYQQKMRTEWP
jgi:hypothetical protein